MEYVVGIDEVGRGPLAGPVVVCALLMPKGLRFPGLKDSKRLTPAMREIWFRRAVEHAEIDFEIARVYPRTIDRINVSRAADLAAHRAYKRLVARSWVSHKIIVDGNLRLPEHIPYQSFMKGDERFVAIRMASVVAKVVRDRYMVRLSKRYPGYAFYKHKGYGTGEHREAIQQFGYSDVHRRSFSVRIAEN